jgi:hypothetical protein
MKEKKQIAFGSSVTRDVLFMKRDVSRFACQYVPELFPNIAPTSYNTGDITSAFHSICSKVRTFETM